MKRGVRLGERYGNAQDEKKEEKTAPFTMLRIGTIGSIPAVSCAIS